MPTKKQSRETETFDVKGDDLLKKIKEVIHEGNVRRIIIKKQDGTTVAEFPLSIGVVGVLLAPVLAAVATIAALIGDCTLVVERRPEIK